MYNVNYIYILCVHSLHFRLKVQIRGRKGTRPDIQSDKLDGTESQLTTSIMWLGKREMSKCLIL